MGPFDLFEIIYVPVRTHFPFMGFLGIGGDDTFTFVGGECTIFTVGGFLAAFLIVGGVVIVRATVVPHKATVLVTFRTLVAFPREPLFLLFG